MKQLLLIFFCLSLFAAEAQNGFTTYTTNLSINGGNKQTAFLVDNAGNKWISFAGSIGGNIGLVKYDNTNWTLYNTTSSPALPSNHITSLVQDSIGNIWIGTDSGLVKYNGIQFSRYTVADGLPTNHITSVDAMGDIVCIGTLHGLSRYDGIGFTNCTVANSMLANDSIYSVKMATKKLVWLGGNNRLMSYLKTNSVWNIFNNYPITPSPGIINCIFIDGSQKWLGTTNTGVLTFNGTIFSNVSPMYTLLYNYAIPNTVYDISRGVHNGLVLKMVDDPSNSASVGLVELAPNNKVYQYLNFTPQSVVLGDYIEKQGNKLLISQSGPGINYIYPNMYCEFDTVAYKNLLNKADSTNFKYLDINHVKAAVSNISDMHWDFAGSGNASYEVPKGSGNNSNFATALWIGGLDGSGQLHTGAQTYRQSGVDYWPGPLDTILGTTDVVTSNDYNKIWKVSSVDINDFIMNGSDPNYTIPESILNWPAHGGNNNARFLAPFVDIDGDQNYNPQAGDYPKIKGDQALYFIYNDNLSAHESTDGLSMGIEVQVMAYAYGCPDVLAGRSELGYTTFYDYKIINRSSTNYHDVYIGLWSDVDMGYYGDDFIGCNVADNYGYAYNGDSNDQTGAGINGYGNYPPAQGFAIMKGPLATIADGMDNDNDGTIDEVGEDCKLNKFTYFNNSTPGMPVQTTDPHFAQEYYQYMNGYWKDGTPFTCGGNAYGGTTQTGYVFAGDPNGTVSTDPSDLCGNWNEVNAGNIPNDRRLVMSCGPFTFAPGQMQEVEYAFVTSFDSSSTVNSNLLSVAKLKTDIQKVKAFYELQNKPSCLQAGNVGVDETLKQIDFAIYPNPARSLVNVVSSIEGSIKINYELVDVLGKTVLKNESRNNSFTVNIESLNSGIYFLKLDANGSVVVKKIVKE